MMPKASRTVVLSLAAIVALNTGMRSSNAGAMHTGSLSGGVPQGAGGADPFFTFTYDDGTNVGFGSFDAVDLGGGNFGITSGTLQMTAGMDVGTYGLYQNPDPWNVVESPSTVFFIDDVLFFSSNPQLDVFGMLFTGSGIEINIWGNAGATDYSYYSYDSHTRVFADQLGSFSVTPTPEPGSLAQFLGLGIVGLGRLLWRKMR